MDDGDRTLEGFRSVEGVVFLEDIHEGMLPFSDILHR